MATKLEVARVAVNTRIMAIAIVQAMTALHDDNKAELDAAIKVLNTVNESLDKQFNELTGWTPDA